LFSRPIANQPDGKSVIAGYPWFGDWGRDTMISLPGLTLATGRPEIALRILQTFASFVSQGMLPNVFPGAGDRPEYNTADASLWFFEAWRAYVAATADARALREVFPVLCDMIAWHQRGTRYGIALRQLLSSLDRPRNQRGGLTFDLRAELRSRAWQADSAANGTPKVEPCRRRVCGRQPNEANDKRKGKKHCRHADPDGVPRIVPGWQVRAHSAETWKGGTAVLFRKTNCANG
jgi:hypothetical protein